VPAAAILAIGVWWVFLRGDATPPVEQMLALGSRPALTTDRPEAGPVSGPYADVPEKGESPSPGQPAGPNDSATYRNASVLTAGRQALERGDLITARAHLSEALLHGLEEPDRSLIRAELTRIGNETIFSQRILDDDPLVSRYVIQAGDTLGKVAKENKVSADLLAAMNGIVDKNRIRAGQTIKVVTGPFRAVVHKQSYTMDVYIGNTFVKHFKVGLGADGSTPAGEWRVATKLVNPTYYPPRGGQIVAADDPNNPLAERWIGLVGVSGEAVGQQRYGIHGTIEPESIGRSVSLGCIRMYNEDVEALYTYLVERHSTVTVLD
jgi:lipoprotein-anchoring transpeptidase ErfK/SrfK